MAEVTLRNLSKKFGDQTALDRVDLTIAPGEFVSVLGPSGCGKTTLLRLIAGFETPAGGEILLDGNPVTNLRPSLRNVGMVFQNYALFPHMTVFQNVAFGLEGRGIPKGDVTRRVRRVVESVRLTEKMHSLVPDLSGGEQQRVAVARAVVVEPSVLLFDEPLSNLDPALRISTREEIREIQRRTKITTIYVTHDQAEALSISDRIAVLNMGAVQQVGTPESLYTGPANSFVAEFLGGANLLRGEWDSNRPLLRVGSSQFDVPGEIWNGRRGRCTIALKPEHIIPFRAGGPAGTMAKILSVEFGGFTTALLLEVNGVRFRSVVLSSGIGPMRPGETVSVRIEWSRAAFFGGGKE